MIDKLGSVAMFYLADLVDTSVVSNLLEKNNIEYLHVCRTWEYRRMDMWDSQQYEEAAMLERNNVSDS